MRIKTYRDQAHAVHFDLTGEGAEPWTVDLVSVASAALLASGFICALAAHFY